MLGGGGTIPRPASAPTGKKAVAAESGEDDSDDDDAGGSDDDSEAEGSDESEGEELDDEGLEAALAAAGKTGVDRDLLRKLIGKLADDDEEDSEGEVEPEEIPPPVLVIPDSGERPAPAISAPKDADPYDSYVRLLALEPRAHATNRLKTPLELAQDAAKELREREESRLRRERGEEEPEEEGEGNATKKRKRKPEADDLEDDFLREELGSEAGDDEVDEGPLGRGLEGGFGAQVIEDRSDEEEEEGSDGSEEEDGSDGEEEDEFEGIAADLEGSDDEEVEGAPEALVSAVVVEAPKSRTWGGKDVKPELPFTFPCPSTHSEFVNLLSRSGVAEADTATVVKRIRVLYHPGLGESNKGKLQVRPFPSLEVTKSLTALRRSSRTFFSTTSSTSPLPAPRPPSPPSTPSSPTSSPSPTPTPSPAHRTTSRSSP